MTQFFRAGVGAVLYQDGKVLALERSDVRGAFQFPQGGLEDGEEPLECVHREIKEETGIEANELELVCRYPQPLAYELPAEARSRKTGRGQTQYWFLFRFSGDHIDVPVGEFAAYKWMTMGEIVECCVPFRRGVYRLLHNAFLGELK